MESGGSVLKDRRKLLLSRTGTSLSRKKRRVRIQLEIC